ncbi:MAG: UbiA family prenyltransferase [Aulosira sp. ZfuVER01]|nr:UbiA family prenyltransferase [Aulosira sp. ZfuVER01]MDZ7999072.1 UbiA family prenyltransferase [Aulosira sp. DedVER01a]MDZ8051204.1 UbiA family prenyltransferase [Aulosira sp. ZfuCHP01]
MNTQAKALLSPLFGLIRIYHNLQWELVLMWQFIWRDYSSALLPGLLFLIAAWKVNLLPLNELPLQIGRGIIYFWLYILSFCIPNQIVGIEEDKLNKPNRPLVTGLVSVHGALVRWVVSMIFFSCVGWWFGVLEWALLWQICIILNNFGRWDKHWITKNIIMGVGTVAQLAAAYQLVAPLTPIAWRWILVLAGVWLTISAVQDLRDIEGDRAIGRNTLPIAFGETASRVILSLGFALLPFATHLLLMMPVGITAKVLLCDMALAVLSLIVAVRIIFYRSPQADHRTYMLFTYWFCLILASAIVIL